ncbi:hypothetical protein ScalyP_jg2392 [Parmales sp. scaly parma]|nr:hypothetical protein ScalyP_jg2392 [Parmales sp. scaly parma]
MSANGYNMAHRLSKQTTDNLLTEDFSPAEPMSLIQCTRLQKKFGLIPKECSKYFASTAVTSGAKFATKQEELDAISKAMDGMDPGAIALAKEAAMNGQSHTGKAKLQRRYTGGMARN